MKNQKTDEEKLEVGKLFESKLKVCKDNLEVLEEKKKSLLFEESVYIMKMLTSLPEGRMFILRYDVHLYECIPSSIPSSADTTVFRRNFTHLESTDRTGEFLMFLGTEWVEPKEEQAALTVGPLSSAGSSTTLTTIMDNDGLLVMCPLGSSVLLTKWLMGERVRYFIGGVIKKEEFYDTGWDANNVKNVSRTQTGQEHRLRYGHRFPYEAFRLVTQPVGEESKEQ